MHRIKRHRIKEEKATTSSLNRSKEEHDLAYFIHDRVELMHQVFSVLKSKELKSFAPECVRRLSIDDLQELCLEELLGISSKRLCAILDGADPPSDTESSSQSEQLETISLDSISSDDEILSQGSKKKKHKHRHSKKKRRKKSKGSEDEQGETRASRAGLTVLELLELQARARAIRAQLHKEPDRTAEPAAEPPSSDTDEVLIKEEPPEVVEISSDDEKPDVHRLQQRIVSETSTSQANETEKIKNNGDSQTVTKRINDLVITVPQSKPTRKIKLKRQKPAETATRKVIVNEVVEKVAEVKNTDTSTVTTVTKNTEAKKTSNVEVKNKIKKNKKKKKKARAKEGSDEDEITIQLSDSEKMDLLEDLEAKNLDAVSSSDSDSSSSDDEQDDGIKEKDKHDKCDAAKQAGKDKDEVSENVAIQQIDVVNGTENKKESTDNSANIAENPESEEQAKKDDEIRGYVSNNMEGTIEINNLPVITDNTASDNDKNVSSDSKVDDEHEKHESESDQAKVDVSEETVITSVADKTEECVSTEKNNDIPETSSCPVAKSDGEISDRESSEVEASDVQPEVVCISDDEGKKKKKKKKDKKSKKEKKKSGFREDRDENFYKDTTATDKIDTADISSNNVIETKDYDDDDVYEYLEISDDSSCYEVEGVSVLSKEPTAEEIEAFSAKMDEIEIDREETVIPTKDARSEPNETSDLENVSWKDRYLGSKKVKKVLTTSNILNAIRKKNRELKKKLEEAKKVEQAEKEANEAEKPDEPTVEDGTMEQYETLQGSTKYVDPVKAVEGSKEGDSTEITNEGEPTIKDNNEHENVTKEMKKDAKMLLKMYKRLLKYNDINKQKDPSKKKKKKQKKSKEKDKNKDKT